MDKHSQPASGTRPAGLRVLLTDWDAATAVEPRRLAGIWAGVVPAWCAGMLGAMPLAEAMLGAGQLNWYVTRGEWSPAGVAICGGLAALLVNGIVGAVVQNLLRHRFSLPLLDHVRTNLVEHGLLRLALEPQPHERLAQLEPILHRWMRQAGARPASSAGSMEQRVRWLAQRYAQCCRGIGLPPYPPAFGRLRGMALAARWAAAVAWGGLFALALSDLTAGGSASTFLSSVWSSAMAAMWLAVPLPVMLDTLMETTVRQALVEALEPAQVNPPDTVHGERLPPPPVYEHTLARSEETT